MLFASSRRGGGSWWVRCPPARRRIVTRPAGDRVNIFVGNLPYRATEQELRTAFEQFGQVASASIIVDRMTGQSRGFGFVVMPTKDEGDKAIQGMNGAELAGRKLTVNEARPRAEGGGGGGGGGGYGDGGGGGGRRGGGY